MPKTYRVVTPDIDWEDTREGDGEGGYPIPEDVYLALKNMKSPIVCTFTVDLKDILKGGDDD